MHVAQQSASRRITRGHLVIRAVIAHRLGPADRLTDDIDVLPRACQRLAERLAVPPFGYLLTRNAQAQYRATVGNVIQGHHGHRCGRRGTGRHRDDTGGEADPGSLARHPSERDKSLSPVRFRGPCRIDAYCLTLIGHPAHDVGDPGAPPRNLNSELHQNATSPLRRLLAILRRITSSVPSATRTMRAKCQPATNRISLVRPIAPQTCMHRSNTRKHASQVYALTMFNSFNARSPPSSRRAQSTDIVLDA